MLEQVSRIAKELYDKLYDSVSSMLVRIGTAPTIDEIPKDIRDFWSPPEFIHPAEWMPKNIYFSLKDGANPGYWSFRLFPQSLAPLSALADRRIEEIVLRFGTRAGKTSIVTAFACWTLANDPGQIQFTAPTENDAHDHCRTKLLPMIERCPPIRRLLPPAKERNMSRLDMTKTWIWYGWLGSPSTLSARAIRYMIVTEVNLGGFSTTAREGDPIAMARDRVKDAIFKKVVYEGKPIEEDVCRLESLIKRTDHFTWFYQCPECFAFESFVEGDKHTEYGLHWEKTDKGSDPELARQTAHYITKCCGTKLTDEHKSSMNVHGVWLRDGDQILKDEKITEPTPYFLDQTIPAGYRLEGKDKKLSNRIGFTLSSLPSNIVSFAEYAYELVASYQSHDPRKIQAFENSWRAKAFRTSARAVTIDELLQHIIPGSRLGHVPFTTEYKLVTTADVQLDRIYFICRAYTYGGTSYLVDYGMISNQGTPGQDLHDFHTYITTTIYTNDMGGRGLTNFVVMDAGYAGRKTEVNDYCFSLCPRAAPAIGRPQGGFASSMDDIVSVRKMPSYMNDVKQMELWKIGFQSSNTQLFDGTLMIPVDKPGCWYLPEDVKRDYLDQLLAVRRTKRKTNANTIITGGYLWEQIVMNDHYLDCERMALAFSIVRGYSRQKQAEKPTTEDE